MQTAGNPWKTGPNTTRGEAIQIPSPGGQLKAYIAMPETGGTHPGVVVIHENKGLVPYLRDVADGLASEGFIAIVPDLLSREGGTDHFANPDTDVPPVLSQIPRDRHVEDMQAAYDYLKANRYVGKIGVTGFCFGGGMTWLFATRNPELATAVPFYGPNPPIEDVAKISGPVLAIYAENDDRINQGQPAIREALAEAGLKHEIKSYPGTGHAFHNHHNAERHNAEQARQAWQAAVAWLKQNTR